MFTTLAVSLLLAATVPLDCPLFVPDSEAPPLTIDSEAPPLTIVVRMPFVLCRCPADAQNTVNDRTEFCGATLCFNITDVTVFAIPADCVLVGVECAATSTERCRFAITCTVSMPDGCCCGGDGEVRYTDYTVVGGTTTEGLQAGSSAQVEAKQDAPCNNSTTMEVSLYCPGGNAPKAQIKYTCNCWHCRQV